MNTFIRSARDRASRALLRLARRVATDFGWSRICHDLGAPNMLSGLLALRDRGVYPRRVVDGGACVGDWTRLFRSVFPEAAVLMIEPQERHAAALRRLCEQQAPKVKLAHALMGPPGLKTAAFVVLDDAAGGTGSSVLPENSNVPRHVVDLPVTTLDALVEEQGLPAPDFIKLDVQGFELEVLKGAATALATAEFVLLEVSLWQYNQGSPLLAEVVWWMNEHGFRAYEIFDISRRGDGVLVQVDVLFVRKDSPRVAEEITLFPVPA